MLHVCPSLKGAEHWRKRKMSPAMKTSAESVLGMFALIPREMEQVTKLMIQLFCRGGNGT